MTLARQQWLFLAIALAIVLGIVADLIHNQHLVSEALDDLSSSQAVVRTVVRMRNIAAEVTAQRSERLELQWRAGLREFEHALGAIPVGPPSEGALIRGIRANITDSDQLFRRLVQSLSPENNAAYRNETEDIPARISGALHIMLGDVSLLALQLADLQAVEVRAARANVLRTSALLITAMLAILAAYMVVFHRVILAPIKRLQAAADRIASGDLEHRVALNEGNEIGELGRRFDNMAEQVQASRVRMESVNKELEAFAYSVSHDLRAPLRGMDGFSRILLEQHVASMDEDARHCLKMIRDNAQQMGRLIDDLLAFSRLSQKPLRKELVDHTALVRNVLQFLLQQQDKERVEVAIGDIPPCEADSGLMKQVWQNLIANALKFSRKREKATIEVGSRPQHGVPVYFVKDNGIGFDMRYAHKLFGVFQRLNRAEDYEGTGVGLAIVQRIVVRHGGRVWAEGEKDKGATFYFTLQETHDGIERG